MGGEVHTRRAARDCLPPVPGESLLRTLLVDNVDAHTYNLFQLIAQAQDAEPVVIRNDTADGVDLDDFDNVVISPGPGHFRTDGAPGLSGQVLAQGTIPVLGVCLGQQGIGLTGDSDVAPTPIAPRGHLAEIRHDGRGLFRDIPQAFTAVRYHSMRIRDALPAELEGTAWSADGMLMGLRHRDRPLWEVEFHPESVLTEYGQRLFVNFRDLTLARPQARRRTPATTPASPTTPTTAPAPAALPAPGAVAASAATTGPGGYRLHRRVLRWSVDPELAFTRRFAAAPHAFWLDSSRVEQGRARFSFFGDGTGPLAELVRYEVATGTIEIEQPGQPPRRRGGSVFDYLKTELARRRVDDPTLPFDFTCGYVGYFGYEMKADCGSTNRHRAATPDACWLFADRMVVVDHQEQSTYVLCLAADTPEGLAGATGWLDQTVAFLRTQQSAPPQVMVGARCGGETTVEPWLVRDRERYLADVDACKRELTAGESYEIGLSNAAWLPAVGDPLGYYRMLRRYNPAPYAAFLRFGDVAVASSAPERFLKITRDGTVETRPTSGTAARDERPAEDARLRAALANSPRVHAENLMIVDLLRNDLGRMCQVGSVEVPTLMATETHATVHQLVATVRGQLLPDADAVDCVRACFPAGSVTGAPRLRTLEIIDAVETEARGVYSGAIGFLSCNGTADLNTVIRTAVFVDGRMHLGAGSSIFLDSEPADEYDEILLKMAAPMRAYRAWRAANRPVQRRPRAAVDRVAGAGALVTGGAGR